MSTKKWNTKTITQHPLIRRISISVMLFSLVLLFTAGCQKSQPQDVSYAKTGASLKIVAEANAETSPDEATAPPCTLVPIIVPTPPAEIPGYTELDPATQLHVTGTAPEINLESYRLEVTGNVKQPLTLSYDDLRCMPKIEARPTLICPGFFKDIATWAGVPLQHVLELAGVKEGTTAIKLISADGYATSVLLADALSEKNFLAYEWEGEPVPILHGFPVRAVFPELEGNKWVKWLVKINVY